MLISWLDLNNIYTIIIVDHENHRVDTFFEILSRLVSEIATQFSVMVA